MPLQVPCPNCGAKLKAPDTAAGKKVKCKQCGQGFRIPGVPVAESLGDDDIPVADFVEDAPAPPPPPAKNVAALPSADPFDFGKAGAKAAPPAVKPAAPVPAAAPRPAFGAAKADAPKAEAAPKVPPVASKPAAAAPPAAKPAPAPAPAAKAAAPAPAPSKPAAEAAKPARLAKAEEAAAPAAKPAKQPEPLPPPPAPAPAADPFAFDQPDAGGDDMFAFGDEPAAKPSKSRRRYDHDDDEEDDRPAKAKKRRDEDEDEAPRKKKSRDEEDDEEDERPAKSKSKSKASEESYNPFSNFPTEPEPEPEKSKTRRDEDDDERKGRKKRGDGDEDEEEKPHYRRPDERPASKMLLYVGIFGVVSLLLGVLAATMYVKNVRQQKREAEEAAAKKLAEEKVKEEPPPAVPPDPGKPAVPPDPKVEPKKDKIDAKVDPKVDPKTKVDPKVDPKGEAKVDPKADPKVDPKAEAVRPKDPGPAGNTISFQGLTPIAVGTLPAKPTQADGPRAGGPIDFPLATVKRIFPPFEKNADTCVLVQVAPPVGGKGEKLALESYGPNGNRVGGDRIDYDGDGLDPIADARASTEGRFFLAAPNGKLHVWSMNEKKKLADGIDPYAGTPHEKEGLAAAYLTTSPNVVILVSTAGAVQSYDLVNRKIVKDFIPPKGAPGRVAMDKSVAKASGNGSIVVAVGGVIYQLEANEGLKEIRKHDLTGDVSRSLALAVSATPGRFLYVFETVDKGGKKEVVVMGVPINDPTKRIAYRAPAALGEPRGALWAGDEFGGVIFKDGIVWFNDHDNRFFPLLYTVPPAVGAAAGDDKALWFVVPHSKQANRSVVVSLGFPLDGFEDYQENFAKKQPLRAVRIDASGLSK